jgi:hypothetical protein
MLMIGIDAHKRTHTVVVVDERGRQLAQRTTGTVKRDHLALLSWAATYGSSRVPVPPHLASRTTVKSHQGKKRESEPTRPSTMTLGKTGSRHDHPRRS